MDRIEVNMTFPEGSFLHSRMADIADKIGFSLNYKYRYLQLHDFGDAGLAITVNDRQSGETFTSYYN